MPIGRQSWHTIVHSTHLSPTAICASGTRNGSGQKENLGERRKIRRGAFEPRELFSSLPPSLVDWWPAARPLYDVRSVNKKFILKPYTFLVLNQICSFYLDLLQFLWQ